METKNNITTIGKKEKKIPHSISCYKENLIIYFDMQICVHFRTLFSFPLFPYSLIHTHTAYCPLLKLVHSVVVVVPLQLYRLYINFSIIFRNAIKRFATISFIYIFLSYSFLTGYLFVMAISNLLPMIFFCKRVCCSFSILIFLHFIYYSNSEYCFCYCYNNDFLGY